jgi:Tfp pilus assembly protein PilX
MMKKKATVSRESLKRQGIALVTVLAFMVVLVSIVTISSLLALSNRRSSTDSLVATRAQYAAEAGIEQALHNIYYIPFQNWKASADSSFKVNGQDAAFDTCAFKKWLTGKWTNGDPDRAVNKNNNATCQYYTNAAVATPAIPNLYNDQVPVTLTGTVGGAAFTVQIVRTDDNALNKTTLAITSLGTVKQGTTELSARQLNRTVEISTTPFDGDRFAVLTKAVNCSLCHLHVDNMTRAYADPTSTASFERVRMAVLDEDVCLNPAHDGDTFIGGTLYVRRNVSCENASEVYSPKWVAGAPGRVSAGSIDSIRGLPFGQTSGDPTLNAPIIDTPNNKTLAKGKVYKLYPKSSDVGPGKAYTDWPDGSVPDSFPTIVPDTNGDDFISDTEWANYVGGAPAGTLRVPSGSSATIFGVRRPGSTAANAVGAPITYDPTQINASLNTTIPQAFAGNFANVNTQLTNLTTALRANNNANMQVAGTNLITNFRGWLIQEALASPNNRDYEPGSRQAITATGQTISTTINPNGTTENNFWVRYVPNSQMLQLIFRYSNTNTAAHTCTPSGFATSPTVVRVGTNCAILNVPLSSADIFPSVSNVAATTLASSSVWDGNLIINAGTIGASNTAVEIDGTVNINGDVVIRGQIRGKGRLVARGNIYIVGDFVYNCGVQACKAVDGSNPSYRNPTLMPLVGLLAGGVIAVGDHDFPDYRASNGNTAFSDTFRYAGGVFDLVNDQVGRYVQLNTSNGTSTLPAPLPYYNIPGSTGTNSRGGNCWGDMGFVPMTAANANDRARNAVDALNQPAVNRRYFKSAPFGLMVARPGFCSYEQGGTQLNNGNTASVITLSPSNGPIRTGSSTNSGFFVAPNSTNASQLATGLACSTTAGQSFQVRAQRFNGQNAQPLMTGFWCMPTGLTGSYHRTWSTDANTNPANDASSWVAQSPQNATVDANAGMTTGWLAGVLDARTAGVNTFYARLGDMSQTRLLKLMWLSTTESGTRDVNPDVAGVQVGPLRTDGIFYSTHGIFTLARSYQNTWQNARSTNEGRWIHNGSVIAAELGFLVTGDYTGGADQRFTVNNTAPLNFDPSPAIPNNAGPAMGIIFDERAVGFLQVQSGNAVRLRRIGAFSQANR